MPDYAWEVIRRSALYICSLIKPDLSTPMIGDADRDDLTTRRADTSIYEGMNLSFFLQGKTVFIYFSAGRSVYFNFLTL